LRAAVALLLLVHVACADEVFQANGQLDLGLGQNPCNPLSEIRTCGAVKNKNSLNQTVSSQKQGSHRETSFDETPFQQISQQLMDTFSRYAKRPTKIMCMHHVTILHMHKTSSPR
jgi:hypothetical protein